MLVLGIDVGTSSCKVGVYSDKGLIASAGCDYDVRAPRPGYVEIDAMETLAKIKGAVKRALAADGVRPGAVRAVSFSSMGEAVVPVTLDRTVLGPSILGYDCRGTEHFDNMTRSFDAKELFAINTNILGPQYTFAKLMWIKEHDPTLYERTDKFLFWADFLGFMFGAEPYTTYSLANRSLLMDVRNNNWSDRLLAWSGIDREKLGRMRPAGEAVGKILPGLADELDLPHDVLIVSGGHDQACNSLGSGCLKAGDTVVGMGTYECYTPIFPWPEDLDQFRRESMNVEHHALPGLYMTFLYTHSGLLVNWFMKTFAPNEQGNVVERLNAEMPDGPTRLLFLPHNEPPQWPEFLSDTGGAFVNLKTNTSRGEMFKALLEGITFYFVDAIDAMRRTGICPGSFIASGGSSRSDAWMQMRADILGMPFTRLAVSEGSLTGAAMLAAVGAGLFASYEEATKAYVTHGRTFTPDTARHERYRETFSLYKRLYPSLRPLLKDLNAGKPD